MRAALEAWVRRRLSRGQNLKPAETVSTPAVPVTVPRMTDATPATPVTVTRFADPDASRDFVPEDPGVPPLARLGAGWLTLVFLGFFVLVLGLHLWRTLPLRPSFTLAHPASGDPARGEAAFVRYGCQSCHINNARSARGGEVGPRLDRFVHRVSIAGQLPNNEANLIRFIRNPQEIVPGSLMPDLNVTDLDARDLAAYLYTLGSSPR